MHAAYIYKILLQYIIHQYKNILKTFLIIEAYNSSINKVIHNLKRIKSIKITHQAYEFHI